MAASMLFGGLVAFVTILPPSAQFASRFREPLRHEDMEEIEAAIPDSPLSDHDPHEIHHIGT
ncbi:hypothetical protein E2C01_005347 [Portunus trituberculatus]|uniref:Uncharacterized protein n=1 Tax=Portunus trituberculatus TaxID=210409 RepID=A0A5B7CYY2_PORTR|nr:hypothetical protein [Portunus trituberculatus]